MKRLSTFLSVIPALIVFSALSATAVEMVTKSMHHEMVFRADHPFLFIIRHNPSGSIVFMGRVVDPGNK